MSDAMLVKAIAQGDRSALSALYDRYAGLMLSVARRMLGEEREAEDLLHDVFLEVWRKAGDYKPERASVRTWLMMRLRSRALDRCKSAVRSRTVGLDDVGLSDAPSTGPQRLLEVSPDRHRLHKALGTLPEAQRQVLRLSYFQGLSSSEIANALGIPLGTVKSRAAAGLRGLRRGLVSSQGGGL